MGLNVAANEPFWVPAAIPELEGQSDVAGLPFALQSWAYCIKASPICFSFEAQVICRAFSRAEAKTGNKTPANMAIIAITTNNSINVNAFCRQFRYKISSWEKLIF
jgi:hypothetical protein